MFSGENLYPSNPSEFCLQHINELEKDNEILEKKVKELEELNKLKNGSVSKEDFSIVWNSVNTLQEEKDILEQDKDSLKEKVKDLEEDLTEIVSERNQCIDKVDNLLYENDELEGQVEDLEEKVIRKKDKINTLKEENEKLRENMTGILDTIYSDEGPRLLDLLGDIGDVVEKVDNLNTLKEEYNTSASSGSKLKKVLEENKKLKEVASAKELFEEYLKKHLKEARQKADNLTKTLEDYEHWRDECENLKDEIHTLEEFKFQADLKSGKIPLSCGVKTQEEADLVVETQEELHKFIEENNNCNIVQSEDGKKMFCFKEKVVVVETKEEFEEICGGGVEFEELCGGTVELKSKEDKNMDKQKKKLASALSRLNSIKKICESDNGNFQEVKFIMEEHSGKGDLICEKHSKNEIRLAKIDKVYQEYQLFLETPHTTSNDFNNALCEYVSKINKILEE